MTTLNSAAATLAAAAAAAITYPKPGTMRATLWTMLVAAGTKGVSATDMQAVFPSWEKRHPVEAMRIMRGRAYNLPIVGRKLADGTPIWFVAGNEPAAGTVVTAATPAAAAVVDPAAAAAATVVETATVDPAAAATVVETATVDPAAAAATVVETATVDPAAAASRAVRNAKKREANRKAHK